MCISKNFVTQKTISLVAYVYFSCSSSNSVGDIRCLGYCFSDYLVHKKEKVRT